MAIKLRVISDHYRDLRDNSSRVFGVNGGTIGRASDNDWVLPDPRRVVSAHHFQVQFHGGRYWLIDTSTNGVFVNDADEPASVTGRIEMRDGDRLRMGDYEILVSVDNRIDFLPASGDENSAAKHLDTDIGHSLDLDSLFTPRDTSDDNYARDTSASGSLPAGNVFGVRIDSDARQSLLETLQRTVETLGESSFNPGRTAGRFDSVVPDSIGPEGDASAQPAAPAAPPPPPLRTFPQPAADNPEWAMKTRRITREELDDALTRRKSRVDARERAMPFHQQASSWTDLRSAVQAFCRGAGIEPATLSAEAQAMLPLVAGQLLRETIVGLGDLARARTSGPLGAVVAALPLSPGHISNPLRSSSSVEQSLLRLFESQGRMFGGPVDSLRDVLQETRDHELALAAGMRAGVDAVFAQLAPASIADQFEQGRSRQLAPGQDPRPKYWEHYSEFFRLLTQQTTGDAMPRAFTAAFEEEYGRVRAELRQKRPG